MVLTITCKRNFVNLDYPALLRQLICSLASLLVFFDKKHIITAVANCHIDSPNTICYNLFTNKKWIIVTFLVKRNTHKHVAKREEEQMDTSYFEEFVILAEMQKYADAAEHLSISEPSLSRHIKALESELGVTLFDRTSRRVSLNNFGRIFLPYAKQFLTLQRTYIQELEEAQLRGKNTMVIGTLYPITELISKFYNYDSNVSIISTGFGDSNDTMVEKLRSGKCEVAFLIDPYKYANEFVIIPCIKDRYVAVLPQDHPLALKPYVQLKELKNDKFISFMESTSGDQTIRNLCARAGYSPRISFNADSIEAILSFISGGMGVSILFDKRVRQLSTSDVAIIPLDPDEKVDVCLCYRRYEPLSDAAAEFITFVRDKWPAAESDYSTLT